MIGRVVDIEKDGKLIILWVRGSEKKRIQVVDFNPYFYVLDKNGSYVDIFGRRLRKIIVDDPSKVPEIRERYGMHFEADIPYVRRFAIDAEIYTCVDVPSETPIVSWRSIKAVDCQTPPRIWFMDIEVLSDTLPDPQSPEKPICAITIYDSYLKKYATLIYGKVNVEGNDSWKIVSFGSEDELLFAFLRLYQRLHPDIITGWNVRFDVEYLKGRTRRLGYVWNLSGTQIFDYMEGFKRLHRRRSYKLKSIAVEEGLVDKYQSFSISMTPDEVAEYNYRDVWIMVELEKKYGVLDFHLQLKDITGVTSLEDTLYNTVLVDTALLRLAKRRGIVLPSKPEVDEDVAYEGAVVLEPPEGIFDGVAVFDMARYYPNIMLSFNISPDTVDVNGDIKYPPTNISFNSMKKGLIPELLKIWLKLREKYEGAGDEAKVMALKFLINSVYGVFGHSRFRLYDVRLASTVTSVGREGLIYAKRLAEDRGYKVLYGDTDSLHIQIPFNKVDETVQYLNESIEKYFRERYGVKECTIGLKFEKYFDKVMYFGVKKRYAGLLVWEKGKEKRGLVTVGLEAVRTDQSKFSQEFQEELIKLVLEGANLREVSDFIEKARRDMRSRSLVDIALVKGISKNLYEYKSNAPHIRAVLYSNKYLGTRFGKGSRVYILWVRSVKGCPQTDVIAFDEDTKLPEVEVDWEKMEDVNIWQKAESILKLLKKASSKPITYWLNQKT